MSVGCHVDRVMSCDLIPANRDQYLNWKVKGKNQAGSWEVCKSGDRRNGHAEMGVFLSAVSVFVCPFV